MCVLVQVEFWAATFFCSFLLLSGVILLNIVMAVLVDEFIRCVESEKQQERQDQVLLLCVFCCCCCCHRCSCHNSLCWSYRFIDPC